MSPEVITPRFVEVNTIRGSTLTVKIRVPDGLREFTKYSIHGDGTISVPTPQDGDKRFAWDPEHMGEIFEAKSFFDACVAEGLVPYKVDHKTGKPTSEVMKTFDPKAGQIVFLPIPIVTAG